MRSQATFGLLALVFSQVFLSEIKAAETPPKIPAPQIPVTIPAFNFKATANFDDLRHNILELIGAGKKRVWLLTDALGDSEIATALYLAKFRNLNVRVYLGRDQLNASGSRLPYLRSQSVPAFLRPKTGYTTPTLLFVDQRLYAVTQDLNPNAKAEHGSVTKGAAFQPNLATGGEIIQASPGDVKLFVAWLKTVMVSPEIAYPRAFRSGRHTKEPFQGNAEGAYNYDGKGAKRSAPEGVTRQLPRVPKWKQTEELRKQGLPVEGSGVPAPLPTAPEAQRPLDKEPDEVNTPADGSAPEVEGMREAVETPGEVLPPSGVPAKPWNPAPVLPVLPANEAPAAGQPTTTSP